MAESSAETTALLKSIVEDLKALKTANTQLAANVDGIAGRVNVLAGMKEVHDTAKQASDNASSSSVPQHREPSDNSADNVNIPESPSMAPADIMTSIPSENAISNAKKPGSTSRIILT